MCRWIQKNDKNKTRKREWIGRELSQKILIHFHVLLGTKKNAFYPFKIEWLAHDTQYSGRVAFHGKKNAPENILGFLFSDKKYRPCMVHCCYQFFLPSWMDILPRNDSGSFLLAIALKDKAKYFKAKGY